MKNPLDELVGDPMPEDKYAKENWIGSEEVDGPGKVYFEDPIFDNILDSLVELTGAIWVCQDRMLVMEEVLTQQLGAQVAKDLSEAVEQHIASEELNLKRKEQRTDLIDRVFRGFRRRSGMGVQSSVKNQG